MSELISLFITQVIPLIMKEYENLSGRDDFTPEQRAALDAQIKSYKDFIANPQWKPDA